MRRTRTSTTIALASLAILATDAIANVGNQTSKLLPADGASFDAFGNAVAISGNIAIVSAELDDAGAGSAYLFDTTTGTQLAKLLPFDSGGGKHFGRSVGINSTTAIVGEYPTAIATAVGAAYLFDTVTGQQTVKLEPPDGELGDAFGNSVALSETIAIVGAYFDDNEGNNSGSAYLFDLSTGLPINKLTPNDGEAGQEFGSSVAIFGTIAVVGAFRDNDNGLSSGSAYLFDATTGQQTAKLLPGDGEANDSFGLSVALSGTTVVVGAYLDDDNGTNSGSAYLFDASTGLQTAKLLPSDGAAGDEFGISVAISETIVIIGARRNDENGVDSGSVYVFDVISGKQVGKLLASDGAPDDKFGFSIAMSGTTVLVGAKDDDEAGTDSGSAYLFDTSGSPASTTERNGSGLNASILASVTNPVLGTNWDSDLDCAGHSASVAGLVVYEQPFSGFFLAGGELLVDVTSPFVTHANLPHNGDIVQFSIAVPNDTSLCGYETSAQGVVLGAPGYELSNALDAVAGF